MVAENEADLREELRQVESDLVELRESAAEQRRQIGEQADNSSDPGDRAAALTAVEEQEAVVATLESRRDRLKQRLGAGES